MTLREWRTLLLWTAIAGLIALWRVPWAEVLGVLAIALIGTPHGAADSIRLRALPMTMPRARARLGDAPIVVIACACYLAVTVVVWWAFATWPIHGLLCFVALSVFHFGRTDALAEGRHGIAPATAIIAIAGPFVFWQSEVVRYLVWIGIPAEHASAFTPMFATVLVTGAVLSSIVFASPLRGRTTALWVALPALSLPPAAGFAVYFCALHALRHWRQLREEGLALPRGPVIATMTFTFLLAAVALFVTLRSVAFDAPIWASVAKVVVIGLAALTVPHMLLDAALRGREMTNAMRQNV
jgi:beta-carotene 15,15'-dioxygenase